MAIEYKHVFCQFLIEQHSNGPPPPSFCDTLVPLTYFAKHQS